MSEETNICPFCGGEVIKSAQKCRHCGEWINYNCPICGEIIPKNVNVCPECKTPLKAESKDNKATTFKILAVVSIVYLFILNCIFSLIFMSLAPKDAMNEDIMYGILGLYALLYFVPFHIPIVSLIIGFERKFSAVATFFNFAGLIVLSIFMVCAMIKGIS